MADPLTVADLRRLIADLPGHAPVLLVVGGGRLSRLGGEVARVSPELGSEKDDPTAQWWYLGGAPPLGGQPCVDGLVLEMDGLGPEGLGG